MKPNYLFILFLVISGCGAVPIPNEKVFQQTKLNGMSLESPSNPVDSFAFTPMQKMHINSVAVIPYAFSRKGEPEVYFNHDRQWWGERIDGAAELVDIAHSHNQKVMVKPHVWIHNDWIGTYQLETEEQWIDWEKSYSAYILAYAKMAQDHHAELFCIGTELKYAATLRSAYFRLLISQVREIFSGKITYAANWDSYHDITFWDDLDYIGVNAYFPLSQKDNPDLKELEMAWTPIVESLNEFHERYRKPILITEIGYRNVNKSAGNQWELDAEPRNDSLQAVAYEAFFTCVYPKPWIAGAFLWKWEFDLEKGNPKTRYTRYSPQGKMAEGVISTHFKKY